MNPLISIIIPIYNVEPYLVQCIDSVLHQTYSNLEIILVNDGSTDNCKYICDNYRVKDNRIKVIHKSNGGLSDARNAGIDYSSGDYLYFVDGDDIIHPDSIQILLNISQKEDADIVSSSFKSFKNHQIPIFCPITKADYQVMNASQTLETLCRDNPPGLMSSCMKLYKRNCFNIIRFPLNTLYEDAHTNYKIYFLCKKICYIQYPLYHYRLRVNSIMANTISPIYNLDAFESRYLFLKEMKENAANYCIEQLCWDYLLASAQPRSSIKDSASIKKKSLKKFRLYVRDLFKSKQGSKIHRLALLIFFLFPQLYSILYKLSPWHIRKPYQHLK